MSQLISLASAATADRLLVGGKAVGLGRLIQSGFKVPEGFVIPSEVSAAEVSALLADLLDEDTVYAYRSSAAAEDLATASFAGQYKTVLGVVGAQAGAEAVAVVRDSARDEAASAYRSRTDADEESMAVIVQREIAARVSGVAFSRDPVTGTDAVVLEAVAGAGEELMSGAVTPEAWTIAADAVKQGDPGPEVLSADEANEIARLCREVEDALGGPQDVEWAIDDDGVWLLQARPITALPLEPEARPNPRTSWERSDAFFPEPITPLSYTAWLPTHTRATARAFEILGIPSGGMGHGYYWGRVYDRIIPLVGGEADDRGLPPAPIFKLVTRIHPRFRSRFKTAVRAARDDLPIRFIEEWEAGGRDRIRSRTRQLRTVDLPALSDVELAEHLEAVRAHSFECGLEHFKLAFGGWVLVGQLGELAEQLADWDHDRVIDLVQGHGDASRAEGRALDRICDAVANDPAAKAVVEGCGDLRIDPGEAGDTLRAFLDEFGHRSHMSMTEPTWAEDPRAVLDLVRARLAGSGQDDIDPKTAATHAVDELLSLVADDDATTRLAAAVEKAQLGRPYGDETERDPLEAMGLVHYIAVEAARRFLAAGQIHELEDVAFLEIDELDAALRGRSIDRNAIERRRAEHRWALSNPAPKSMGPPPGPVPEPDLLPAAARPIVGAFMWAAKNLFFTETIEQESDGSLRGRGASAGVCEGSARVVRTHSDFPRIQSGDIVVCPSTMASWSSIFPVIGGLVTEVGGPLSHPGTLAREFGIPAVLAVADATSLIPDGRRIRIDGARGSVTLLQDHSAAEDDRSHPHLGSGGPVPSAGLG